MQIKNNLPTFVIIETQVIADKNLTEAEKILYGFISALSSNRKGECYATNSYLAKFMSCDIRTIQRGLITLRKNGYITTTLKNGNKRIITPTINEFIKHRKEEQFEELFDYDWIGENDS